MEIGTTARRGSTISFQNEVGKPWAWYVNTNVITGVTTEGTLSSNRLASANQSSYTTKTHLVRGFRPPTPWSRYVCEANSVAPYQRTYKVNAANIRTNFLCSCPNESVLNALVAHGLDSSWVGLEAEASVRARNNLANQNWDLGISLAESQETLRFLVDKALELGKAVTLAKRGRWKELGQHLFFGKGKVLGGRRTSLDQRWLEYSFGWRPILDDIHDAATALQEEYRSKDQIFKGTGRSGDESQKTLSGSELWPDKVTVHRSVEIGIYAGVNNSALAYLSAMGLINPWAIAWELVPFSFVLDWFAPVGAFLDSITATAGYSFVAGYRTRRTWIDGTYPFYPSSTTGDISVSPGQCRIAVQRMARATLPTFPIPLPYIGRAPLTSTKLATSAALAVSLLKK